MIVRRQKHILFLSQRGYPNKKNSATPSKTIKRRFRSYMSVKSSTELMLYVVLTMPTLNKAYLFIYLFIYYIFLINICSYQSK
jgi:hypothetical protein